MKVILNKDLATLGEEGDVKDVAKGYARNYLFPRGIALPFTPKTVKMFEARKGDIEGRKEQKRQDSLGLKEKLENTELTIAMSAGATGKLYGAVTSQTIADELAKQGFQIERKRIDITSGGIKSVGKYKATVKLYENQSAEIQITVNALVVKTETPQAPARGGARRRRDETARSEAAETASAEVASVGGASVEGVSVETAEEGKTEEQMAAAENEAPDQNTGT